MKTKYPSGGGSTLQFTTYYKRPGQFRFEYADQDPRHSYRRTIIWSYGNAVKTWDMGKVQTRRSLDTELGRTAGTSNLSSRVIPKLLFPTEISNSPITDLEKPRLMKPARIDGKLCYVIRGSSHGGQTSLWINKETFLLRRIETTNVNYPKVYEFTPSINGTVTSKQLEFRTP